MANVLSIAPPVRGRVTALCRYLARTTLHRDYDALYARLSLNEKLYLAHDCAADNTLLLAVCAAEDRRFLVHPGFDVYAIGRAIWRLVTVGKVSGASTIDQQLVRVLRQRYEPTLRRKVSEIVLAGAINDKFTKSHIFNSYVEVAYFGWRANGIDAFCRRMDYVPYALSRQEATIVAASIKLPLPKKPDNNYRTRLARRMKWINTYLDSQATIRRD